MVVGYSCGKEKQWPTQATSRNAGPRNLAEEFTPPVRLEMLLDMPPVSKEVQIKNSWNPEDSSLNIFIKVCHKQNLGDNFHATFQTCAQR